VRRSSLEGTGLFPIQIFRNFWMFVSSKQARSSSLNAFSKAGDSSRREIPLEFLEPRFPR
jgi:hypothetical protein